MQHHPTTGHLNKILAAGISTFVFASGAWASEATVVPEQPDFPAQSKITYVPRDSIASFKALSSYSEPEWITKNFVETGALPPVEERLPEEPLVFKTGNMPDGIGVYGGTLRHVIGGRPEGWNYQAGQSTGWGGIDIGMFECLTRTAPLYQVEASDMEPLPNLAKSWEWSEDGHTLTMHLIEGAKWSDGVPFTSEDVLFMWEDNIVDPNVTPLNGASRETFGSNTTLKALDDYTVEWTFEEEFPRQYLFNMAYGNFCPGPAHIMKTKHPSYADTTYDEYRNGFPPEMLNWPVMGAWAPVEYRSDDIIVLRRNPYYWKVDEEGHQLPYIDELHYKLSTWADRDIQTIAGSADLSNLEQPENFVVALRRAAEETAPARLAFGPRLIGYNMRMNLSGNGWGEPDARAQAVRELNRNPEFRKAITMAIDRQSLGDSLVRGPFTAIYPGGLNSGTSFYDRESTYYYPYDPEGAKEILASLGLEDTDGNGFVNWPEGTLNGEDLNIILLLSSSYNTDVNLAEGVIGQLQQVGLRVVQNSIDNNQYESMRYGGDFDWMILRNSPALASVVQGTTSLAPVGPRTSHHHRAGPDGTLDLMPYEEQLVEIVSHFIATSDDAERAELMKQYQEVATKNVDTIGLTEFPGALIVNKRLDNVAAGAPIFMFNWAEDAIIRERMFVPKDEQGGYQLFPETLPGKPGADGPVKG
ncbi:ABC transporter substrate-binding protein [Martelella mediterranea]|uniref:Peptide/nickel transport system substrate-binding protein n=1 Tax=Martelella mediterranea TaxID=293089 RepID=A0A4R3P115_9HYPH|nr:ABC transporter substrate-binding protein [Martelella mediterranea]TCT42821.1 peptide/nickel transport system substrate-binding protein [Martelella mediterranea]